MELVFFERTFSLEKPEHDCIEIQNIFVEKVQDSSDALVFFKKAFAILELREAVSNFSSHLHDFVEPFHIIFRHLDMISSSIYY